MKITKLIHLKSSYITISNPFPGVCKYTLQSYIFHVVVTGIAFTNVYVTCPEQLCFAWSLTPFPVPLSSARGSFCLSTENQGNKAFLLHSKTVRKNIFGTAIYPLTVFLIHNIDQQSIFLINSVSSLSMLLFCDLQLDYR